MVVPSDPVCGERDTPTVWRSAAATPAAFKAAITAAAAAALRPSASRAVAALVSTPNSKEARSGTAVAVPLPVTVIVGVAAGEAVWASRGCATPASAAAPSTSAATRIALRMDLMPRIRHRRSKRHILRAGVRAAGGTELHREVRT